MTSYNKSKIERPWKALPSLFEHCRCNDEDFWTGKQHPKYPTLTNEPYCTKCECFA